MAIRRSRGGSRVTTRPPIRTSPRVGSSSPAIIRRSVVFPEPEGPRKTMNSPSRVARLTSLTAPSCPCLKTLVRSLVSTIAMPPGKLSCLLPLGEDALDLLLGGGHRLLRRHLVARRLGEHGGNHEGVEHLVDRGGGVTRVAHVGRRLERAAQDLVFVVRLRLRVVAEELLGALCRAGGAGGGQVLA